jgi:hypothetical protein
MILVHVTPVRVTLHEKSFENFYQKVKTARHSLPDSSPMELQQVWKSELKKLLHDHPGVYLNITTDDSDQISSIFWMSQYQKTKYEKYCDFVSFDDTYKVFDDSRAILFEGFLRDGEGALVCFAQCLHYAQDKAVYDQILRDIERCGHRLPEVVMVDQDAAVIAALESQWPATSVEYCVFHDLKNTMSHFRGGLNEQNMDAKEKMQQVDLFTKDINVALSLPREDLCLAAWDQLIMKYAKTSAFRKYLHDKRAKLSRIAAFSKITHFNYGRKSTSDAEVGHKNTKDALRTVAGCHLGRQTPRTFVQGINYFLQLQIQRNNGHMFNNQQYRVSFKQRLSQTESTIFDEILQTYAKHVTVKCMSIMIDEITKTTNLNTIEVSVADLDLVKKRTVDLKMFTAPSEFLPQLMLDTLNANKECILYKVRKNQSHETHYVSVMTTKGFIACTCAYDKEMGVPCAHIFGVFKRHHVPLHLMLVNSRWFRDESTCTATTIKLVYVKPKESDIQTIPWMQTYRANLATSKMELELQSQAQVFENIQTLVNQLQSVTRPLSTSSLECLKDVTYLLGRCVEGETGHKDLPTCTPITHSIHIPGKLPRKAQTDELSTAKRVKTASQTYKESSQRDKVLNMDDDDFI